MAHNHDHDGHGHGVLSQRTPPSAARPFAIGIALNVAFVAIETAYGVASGSMALVADAAHNLGDVLGLGLAWAAFSLAKRRPSKKLTYGLRKSTVLAALANAVLLFVAVGAVGWEAVTRLWEPRAIDGPVLIVVAGVGVVINGVSALLFRKGQKRDANFKGAYLHLVADAAISLGVVVTGVAIWKTGWAWLDPAVSLAVSAVILVGTWQLLKQSVSLALDAVPEGIDADAVNHYLEGLPGVLAVHDLHIWAMSTTETALTAHLVVETPGSQAPWFVADVSRALSEQFDIGHSTVQIEAPGDDESCRQAPDEAV